MRRPEVNLPRFHSDQNIIILSTGQGRQTQLKQGSFRAADKIHAGHITFTNFVNFIF